MQNQKEKKGHTPGPWPIEHCRTLLRTNKECDFGRKPISDEEVEANAHLISAAPDMLAALTEVLRCAALPDIWAAPIRAAIAKATGVQS